MKHHPMDATEQAIADELLAELGVTKPSTEDYDWVRSTLVFQGQLLHQRTLELGRALRDTLPARLQRWLR